VFLYNYGVGGGRMMSLRIFGRDGVRIMRKNSPTEAKTYYKWTNQCFGIRVCISEALLIDFVKHHARLLKI
jgi:hypothetical protein